MNQNIPIIFIQRNQEQNANITSTIHFYSHLSKNIHLFFRERDDSEEEKHTKTGITIHYYNSPIFDFRHCDKIIHSDFFLYFDDRWNIGLSDTKKYIQEAIAKLDNDIIQVRLTEQTHTYNTNIDNRWAHYNTMAQIFKKEYICNPFTKPDSNSNHVNYAEYVDRNFTHRPDFCLVPSIIRTNAVFGNNNKNKPIKCSDYWETMFARSCNGVADEICNVSSTPLKTIHNTTTSKKTDKDNITIITGFIDMHINRVPKGRTQKYDYIEKSANTLAIPQNMVVFVSEEWEPHVLDARKHLLDKTLIVKVSETDIFMWDRRKDISNAVQKNIAPYDNDYLLMLVNSRYNYMARAIKHNHFNTDFFAWVDFSAGHIVTFPDNYTFKYNIIDKIRIGWIARFNKKEKTFAFNHAAMGGGVWMGHKDTMVEFIRIHNNEFETLLNAGHVINDDRLIFFIFEQYPQLFDTYFSSYGFLLHKL